MSWLKIKKTNRQIIVQKTQQQKNIKTKQHEPYQKLRVLAGAPEG